MQCPSFHPRYRPRAVDSALVVLRTEGGPIPLEGRLWPLLIPQIDGKHDGSQIAEALDGDLDPLDVAFGLTTLTQRGYLTKSAAHPDHSTSPLPPLESTEPMDDVPKLRLVSLLAGDASGFARQLSASSFAPTLCPQGGDEPDELVVVLVRDLDHPALGELDGIARATMRQHLVVVPGDHVVWIGPLVAPWRDARWSCFAMRLREVVARWTPPFPPSQKPLEGESESVDAIGDFFHRDPHAMPSQSALQRAGRVAARFLRQGRDVLPGVVDVCDLQTGGAVRHAIPRCARCAACRAEAESAAHDLQGAADLQGAEPQPEDTLALYGSLVSPLTGLVHGIDDVAIGFDAASGAEPGSAPLALARAVHNYSLVGSVSISQQRRSARPGERASLGRGLTRTQARTGALCEALERASGRFYGNEPLRCARFEEVADEAVHPHATLLFSQRQYARREEWNAAGSAPLQVPVPFDEARLVHWAPAWSITHRRPGYVAAATAYYGFDRDEGQAFAGADSNGCASGATLEHAVLQGLLELVERDAVAQWWYQRLRCAEVRVDGAVAAPLRRLQAMHEVFGRRGHLLDLTTDLGIPVLAAVSLDEGPAPVLVGFGAHLDPRQAAIRALGEVHQCLPSVRSGRAFRIATEDLAAGVPGGTAYLEPAESPAALLSQMLDLSSGSVARDLAWCVERLRRAGLEALVIDQTRLDARLPTARVVVPGLRPMRPRFAPGRLYSAPSAAPEQRLNPAHLLV